MGSKAASITRLSQSIFLVVILAACNTAPVMPTPQATQLVTQSSATPTASITAAPEQNPSDTPEPNAIPTRRPTQVLTATSTPTPVYPFVRDGVPLPPGAVISPENASQLVELARWGKGAIRTIRYSLDGSQVGVSTSQGIYLYDTSSYELVRFLPIELGGRTVAFSEDLGLLAAGRGSGEIQIWDTTQGDLIYSRQVSQHGIYSLSFLPGQDRILYTPYESNGLHNTFILDLTQNDWTDSSLPGAESYQLSSDGSVVAIKNDDGIQVFRLAAPEHPIALAWPEEEVPTDWARSYALSNDGTLLAVGTEWEMRLLVFNLKGGSLQLNLNLETRAHHKGLRGLASAFQRSGPGPSSVKGVAISPNNSTLTLTTGFGHLEQYRLSDGEHRFTKRSSESQVMYSPDGKTISNWEWSAYFHSAQNGELIQKLTGHMGPATDLDVSPNGGVIAVGSEDEIIWLYRSLDGLEINTFKKHTAGLTDLEFSQNGKYLLSGGWDNSAYLWSLDGSPVQDYYSGPNEPWFVTLSYDSRYAAIVAWDAGISLVRVADHYVEKLTEYSNNPAAFSPTSPVLVYDETRGVLKQYNYQTGQYLPDIFLFGDNAEQIEFTNDGQWVGVLTEDKVNVFQMSDTKKLFTLKNPDGGIGEFIFTPDNRLIIAQGSGLSIFSTTDGILLAQLPVYPDEIGITPDGRYLAFGFWDGTVRIWGVPQATAAP